MTQRALEFKKKMFLSTTKCTLVLVLSIVKETQANLYCFDRKKKKKISSE